MSLPSKTAKKASKRTFRGKRRSWGRRGRSGVMLRAPTGSFASRSETFSLPALAGTVYDLNTISLSNLPVNREIAKYYQYYRITSVQMRIKPQFDTFIAGGASGTGVLPYLYFLYDKSGSLGLLNANQFEEAGAKPVRVDDKVILRKWRPAVVTSTIAGLTQFKTSPWLPTHVSTGNTLNLVNHTGAVWYISKINLADATIYDIDITVTVQFRKPMVQTDFSAEKVSIPLIPEAPAQAQPNV